MEIEPGSSRRADDGPEPQSPASRAARISSRVNHAASTISPSLNENG
ncbi:hypothetical protein C731_1385 [Mycolicibacterium hassiacum DSM 44199]|uniref:Uncharacterized protein n=1 Tax=Mycolicibacterium hassiacum (strain DSM 44199 / CIP 105218 / JCM 12690 / 3849) TaxID=1122247 RepID=K5BH66_MYCHD|nr:hypothetical protein C731_1385 [Mycolicibacterium hassiacum DSM 44199]